jgi:hypothetical protein
MNNESFFEGGNTSIFRERLTLYKTWIEELRKIAAKQKIKVEFLGRESFELIGGEGQTLYPLKKMQDIMTVEHFVELLTEEVSRLNEIVSSEAESGELVEENNDPYSGGAEEPYLDWKIVE